MKNSFYCLLMMFVGVGVASFSTLFPARIEQGCSKPSLKDAKEIIFHGGYDHREVCERLKICINAGLNLEEKDEEGLTLLTHVCCHHHALLHKHIIAKDLVNILLEAGALADVRDRQGDTVPMHLVKKGKGIHTETMKNLHRAGLSIHAQNCEGKTLLMLVLEHWSTFDNRDRSGHPYCHPISLLEFLVKEGSVSFGIDRLTDQEGNTAVQYAKKHLYDREQAFFESGHEYERRKRAQELFEEAHEYERRKRGWYARNFRKLEGSGRRSFPCASALEKRAQKQPGWRPSFKHFKEALIKRDKQEVIGRLQSLIELGLPLEEKNNERARLLHYVFDVWRNDFYDRREDFARLLILAGANLEGRNEKGETLLFRVLRLGTPQFIRFLVNKGALVNCTDESGDTPLIEVTKPLFGYYGRNAKEIFHVRRMLIQAGADVNRQGEKRRSAIMHLAKQSDDPWSKRILPDLVAAGADMTLTDYKGRTALMLVVKRPANEHTYWFVDELLKAGAGKEVGTIQDDSGKTALDYAREQGNEQLLELLENNPYENDDKDEYGREI